MSQITNKPNPPSPPSMAPRPPLPLLRPENRQAVGTGLLAAAVAAAILVIFLVVRSGWANLPVTIWGTALLLTLGLTGAWAHLGEPRTPEEGANQMRLLGLTVGGAVGFATAVLGLAMPIFMYSSVFSGGLEVWRQNAWRVMLCALALFGGLTLMFLSLQLGRSVERTSASIRRLLYGYNAALTGLLLLAILTLINVLAYVRVGPLGFFSSQWDWTASGVYSISPATENFLKTLDKPVKVYMVFLDKSLLGKETETMLENCRAASKKLTWTSVSRDFDRTELQTLVEKYQIPGRGLLVVYGSDPGEQHEFIPAKDLYSDVSRPAARGRPASMQFTYKGEGALMKAMTFLAEGKKKAVVYFTQGDGEPELMPGPERGRVTQSLSDLRGRLTRRNYEVKDLRFPPGVDKVPSDAAVVVVANPRTGLPDNAVRALTAYMVRGKGKMIVLADVVINADRNGMVPSGLEPLLGRFNVRLGNERILIPRRQYPTDLLVTPNDRSTNPIVRGFIREDGLAMPFRFEDVRTVEAGPANPRMRNPYKVETILVTYPGHRVWKESNLSDPSALVTRLLMPDNRDDLIKKLTVRLPVAVAVSQSDSKVPNDPQHRNVATGEEKPRLVVFGDASWITDEALASPTGRYNADLFASSLGWLRQRSNIGAEVKEGKERKEFTLAGTATPGMASRLQWTPIALMLLVIVGLGGGIWLVRRR